MANVLHRISRIVKLQSATIRNITMSRQLQAQKVVDEMKEKNPYYEKYAAKIAALQKTSPEEFLTRVDKVEQIKEQATKKTKANERDYSELLNAKTPVQNPVSEIPYKKLEDIMKMDLVNDKTVDEIKQIWINYHKDKDVIAATLTKSQFTSLMERAKTYPVFLLPLPRSQGYEFIVLQFASNTVHFTPLLCYQVHKENAPECLNIVHYTEFLDRDLVLMRGEYDIKVINAKEAQCLANELQLYYGQTSESKILLLEKFTRNPDGFKHMDLIKELETLSIQ